MYAVTVTRHSKDRIDRSGNLVPIMTYCAASEKELPELFLRAVDVYADWVKCVGRWE